MRNCWKIGTRWDDYGKAGTSIFKNVFLPGGVVFATSQRCLEVAEGDLFAVADGYTVIAIAEALTPGLNVTKLRADNYPESVKEYLGDSDIFGCKVKFYILDENDTFEYKKMGKFYHAGEWVTDKVNKLFKKYTSESSKSPNLPCLFDWANKELAQDSFLCWILECATSTAKERRDSPEHMFGFKFVQALLAKNKITIPDSATLETEVLKQEYNIDVACRISFNQHRYGVLIEDKVTANVTNDIEKYKKDLSEDERFRDCTIYPFIVRTGDEKEVHELPYPYFLREDFLNLFAADCNYDQSQILGDFHTHLSHIEERIKAWESSPVNEWDWNAWKGFYATLQRRGVVEQNRWNMVAGNGRTAFLCSYPAWDDSSNIWVGPFVLYWQLEEDRRCLVLKILEVYANNSVVRDTFINAIDVFAQGDSRWKKLKMHKPSRRGVGYSMSLKIIDVEDWYGDPANVQTIEAIENRINEANAFKNAFIAAIDTNKCKAFESLRSLVKEAEKDGNK